MPLRKICSPGLAEGVRLNRLHVSDSPSQQALRGVLKHRHVNHVDVADGDACGRVTRLGRGNSRGVARSSWPSSGHIHEYGD